MLPSDPEHVSGEICRKKRQEQIADFGHKLLSNMKLMATKTERGIIPAYSPLLLLILIDFFEIRACALQVHAQAGGFQQLLLLLTRQIVVSFCGSRAKASVPCSCLPWRTGLICWQVCALSSFLPNCQPRNFEKRQASICSNHLLNLKAADILGSHIHVELM